MKKQRTQKTFSSSSSEWTNLEKEVAEIMIHDLCRFSLLSSVPYTWGRKRKRSETSPSPVNNCRAVNARAALQPVKVEPDVDSGVTLLPVKVEPSSPVTQSNRHKNKPSNKRVSLKKKTESALQTVQELTETKISLIEAVEKVKQHYANLVNYNLNLIKRKQEIESTNPSIQLLRREFKNPKSENRKKVQLGQSNGSINTSKSNIEFEEYKRKVQIQMQMQMFANYQNQNYRPSSSNIALEHNINRDNDGLIILPDLNLIAEESIHVASFQPLDEIRAIAAAQARQRRLEIFRHKKPFGNNSKQH